MAEKDEFGLKIPHPHLVGGQSARYDAPVVTDPRAIVEYQRARQEMTRREVVYAGIGVVFTGGLTFSMGALGALTGGIESAALGAGLAVLAGESSQLFIRALVDTAKESRFSFPRYMPAVARLVHFGFKAHEQAALRKLDEGGPFNPGDKRYFYVSNAQNPKLRAKR